MDQARAAVGVLQFGGYLPAALTDWRFEKSVALGHRRAAVRDDDALTARRAVRANPHVRGLLDVIAVGAQGWRAHEPYRTSFIDDIAKPIAVVARQEIPA